MTIYIIGPISNLPGNNRPAFEAARAFAHDHWPIAKVVIPHDLYTPDRAAQVCPALCWTEAMCACLPVARSATALVALPGWRDSVGAQIEKRERRGTFFEIEEIAKTLKVPEELLA